MKTAENWAASITSDIGELRSYPGLVRAFAAAQAEAHASGIAAGRAEALEQYVTAFEELLLHGPLVRVEDLLESARLALANERP